METCLPRWPINMNYGSTFLPSLLAVPLKANKTEQLSLRISRPPCKAKAVVIYRALISKSVICNGVSDMVFLDMVFLRNAPKRSEMHAKRSETLRNAPKHSEMLRNAPKCSETLRNGRNTISNTPLIPNPNVPGDNCHEKINEFGIWIGIGISIEVGMTWVSVKNSRGACVFCN